MPERNKTSTINVRLKETKSEYSFCAWLLCFYSEIISQQGSFFIQAVCYEWVSYKYFNAVVDKS